MIKNLFRSLLYRMRGDYTTEELVNLGLKVGNNFSRLEGVIIDPAHCWLIEIGDNVTLAPRVHILAHDASTVHYLGYAKIGKVTIGSRVFIGASTVVLPNVSIGDDVIVGANSTVTKNLESGYVYVGNPAHKLCSTEEFIQKNNMLMKKCPCYGEEYTTRANIDETKKEQMKNELKNTCGFVK